MDVGDDSTAGDCGLDECVELFISSDGELEVSRCDSLHLQVLASVASELKHLSCQVLEDGRCVHGRCGADSAVSAHSALQKSVNSSNGELYEVRV